MYLFHYHPYLLLLLIYLLSPHLQANTQPHLNSQQTTTDPLFFPPISHCSPTELKVLCSGNGQPMFHHVTWHV